jgi:hypothetical protein
MSIALALLVLAPSHSPASAVLATPSRAVTGRSTGAVVERTLEETEIDSIVDRLGVLNSPCTYRLEATRTLLPVDDEYCGSESWLRVRELLASGATPGTATSFGAVREALAGAEERLAGRGPLPAVRRWTSRIHFRPEIQVECLDSSAQQGPLGKLRTPQFSLTYRLIPGSGGHQLVADRTSSMILHDPRDLLSPVLLDTYSLSWLRKYAWTETTAAESATRSFKLWHKSDERRYYRFELDARTLLPVSASAHDEASPAASTLSLFEYGPIAAGSSQSWLRSVVQISNSDPSLYLVRAELTEVSFDMHGREPTIGIDPSTVLFDARDSEEEYYPARQREQWPAEIRALVHDEPWTGGEFEPLVLGLPVEIPLEDADPVAADRQEEQLRSRLRRWMTACGLGLLVLGTLQIGRSSGKVGGGR